MPPASPLVCRGCGQTDSRMVVDLGRQPASDHFPGITDPGPDPQWPLQVWHCPNCALVQLGPIAALDEEPVRAVESQTSRDHARRVVAAVLAERPWLAGGTVREFASHHGGSWLEALQEHGCRPEPGGPAALVIDVHALAHEENVRAALDQRVAVLAEGGLLILEFHHLLPLVEQAQFDTIRHGHWTYLSLTTVERLGAERGLTVVQAVAEPVFGGSLRLVLTHESSAHRMDESVRALLAAERRAGLHDGSGLERLQERARASAAALHSFLSEQRAAGRRVLGYGAPSKAAVLLGVADVGPHLLEFTVDAAPAKHGLAVPGVRVPIRPVQDLVAARPEVVLVLTWDIAEEVMSYLEDGGGWGTQYVLPVPTPHTVQPAAMQGAMR